MRTIKICEIKNGILSGEVHTISEGDFPLDLKKCAKTFISGGVKVYIDSVKYNEIVHKKTTD